MGDLRKVGAKNVDIVKRESHRRPGLLTTGLHGGAARYKDHQLRAEIGKDGGARLPEPVAICQQHDYGRDPPGHAEHGESGTATIVSHRAVRFLKQITKHQSLRLLTPDATLPQAAG